MTSVVSRGFVSTDMERFKDESLLILKKAQQEILYLIERGYPIKSASTFVGNHYLLSERQRLAIVRATAQRAVIESRLEKMITEPRPQEEVFLDGLNLIITLEVALSGSTLIKGMDNTIRDLAGLRGTYRLIDKTEQAILLIGDKLVELAISKATFYLDAPVSNTGRLKTKLYELLEGYPFQVVVELVHNAGVLLEKLGNVVTSDAIILNQCKSFLNLAAEIIEEKLPFARVVDLS